MAGPPVEVQVRVNVGVAFSADVSWNCMEDTTTSPRPVKMKSMVYMESVCGHAPAANIVLGDCFLPLFFDKLDCDLL